MASQRYGVRDILECTIRNVTTGAPIVYLSSLKISTIDMTATTVEN